MSRLSMMPQLSQQTRVIWVMVAQIAVVHFIVEALIMGTLSGWNLTHSVILAGLLDCVLLTAFSSWPIYSWVARPFIVAARNSQQALATELADKARQTDALERALDDARRLLARNAELSSRLKVSNARIAEISEQTLQRIGADLHDGPAQLLTYSLMRLGKFEPAVHKTGGNAADEFKTMRSALTDTLSELRNISRGLSLPQLENVSLAETIALAVALHQEQTGTAVKQVVGELPEVVPHAVKSCIYRVIQESLSNATRHAKASSQLVAARFDRDLQVEISDQGQGFDPNEIPGKGLGLNGMLARVESVGGTLEVLSRRGQGTCMRVRMPITNGTNAGETAAADTPSVAMSTLAEVGRMGSAQQI